jgi:hypothetical protein
MLGLCAGRKWEIRLLWLLRVFLQFVQDLSFLVTPAIVGAVFFLSNKEDKITAAHAATVSMLSIPIPFVGQVRLKGWLAAQIDYICIMCVFRDVRRCGQVWTVMYGISIVHRGVTSLLTWAKPSQSV